MRNTSPGRLCGVAGICVRCGHSHLMVPRRERLRRFLRLREAATGAELSSEFDCLYPDGPPPRKFGTRQNNRQLLRDLHAIGATFNPSDLTWVLQ